MTEERPQVRRPVAVLLSRFPLITETFILREIIELERQGQPVLLVPMIRERPAVVHPEALPWIERALYTPWLSAAIVASNLRTFLRKPWLYLRTAGELLVTMMRSPDFLVRTAMLFPKSVHLAERLAAADVRHVHAHFATHPATMAMIIARFAPHITFSITVHAHDIFVNRVGLEPKLAAASGIRAISRFNRSYLTALFPRIPAEKTEVIRVGIDPDQYGIEKGAGQSALRILTVAGLKPYKGVQILVEACARLKRDGVSFVCDIVGDGPLRRSIAHAIEHAGLQKQVRLTGARTQGEVAAMMRRASVFVLPSIIAPDGQMEGIPVALMEAMAASRPVVASALSGIPELVEHEATGLLVDPNNPELLASAIRRIEADPGLAARLGHAGRERVVAEFSLRENVRQLLQWLDGMNPAADIEVPASAYAAGNVGLHAFHETRDSRVFRLLVTSPEPAEVVLKEHRSREGESAPPDERAAREAGVLRELAGRSAEHHGLRAGVPELIAVDGPLIVMKPARGKRLDDVVRERRLRDLQSLERPIESAAVWLRWFHGRRQGGEVRVHGDFWPGNLFVSRDEVTVIDFEGVRPGDPLHDVAYFLVHLELYFPPPFGGRFRRLRRLFLDTYFAGEVPERDVARAEALVAGSVKRSLDTSGWRGRLIRMQLAHHRSGEAA